jgi:hypothetical protein
VLITTLSTLSPLALYSCVVWCVPLVTEYRYSHYRSKVVSLVTECRYHDYRGKQTLIQLVAVSGIMTTAAGWFLVPLVTDSESGN